MTFAWGCSHPGYPHPDAALQLCSSGVLGLLASPQPLGPVRLSWGRGKRHSLIKTIHLSNYWGFFSQIFSEKCCFSSNNFFHFFKTLLIHRDKGKKGNGAIPHLFNSICTKNSFENLNISTKVKSLSFHFVMLTCSLKVKVETKSFPQNSNLDSRACGIPVVPPAHCVCAEQHGA